MFPISFGTINNDTVKTSDRPIQNDSVLYSVWFTLIVILLSAYFLLAYPGLHRIRTVVFF